MRSAQKDVAQRTLCGTGGGIGLLERNYILEALSPQPSRISSFLVALRRLPSRALDGILSEVAEAIAQEMEPKTVSDVEVFHDLDSKMRATRFLLCKVVQLSPQTKNDGNLTVIDAILHRIDAKELWGIPAETPSEFAEWVIETAGIPRPSMCSGV